MSDQPHDRRTEPAIAAMKAAASALVSDDPFDRLVNPEAEQSLLGALMINNGLYEHVADIVRPEDFTYPLHGRIYAAIAHQLDAGLKADPVILRQQFANDQDLTFPGRAGAYLADLLKSVTSIVNGPHYARDIADMAQRRRLIVAARDIIADASSPVIDRTAADVADDAEQRLYEIAQRDQRNGAPKQLAAVMDDTIAAIEDAYRRGGSIAIDTGIADLDRVLNGMAAGDLVVAAGRPSMGKSAFASTIAYNCARQGKRVAIFSLEMTSGEIAARWIAGITGITTDRQRHGRLDGADWDALVEARQRLAGLRIYIDDQPRLSVPQMRQRARRIKRRDGLDLIIVDHLQLVRQGGRQESRRLEIGDATSMLKAVAKELRVPVLLLSQLSRAVEQRDDKRPMLADLRESGDIEQDADTVMFLYREHYYVSRSEPRRRQGETEAAFAGRVADWEEDCARCRGRGEIIVAKNRHGPAPRIVQVAFDAERQRFGDLYRGASS